MGNPGQIIFTESCKTLESSSASREITASNNTNSVPKLRSNLSVITAAGPVLLDGWGIRFDAAYSNGLDSLDIFKIGNSTSENMSILKQGQRLTYERRRLVDAADTTQLNLAQLRRQQYRFDFLPTEMSQYSKQALLVDRFLNLSLPISMASPSVYDFSVTTDPNSWASDRFYIVFQPLAILPVQLKSFHAHRASETSVQLNAEIDHFNEVKNIDVERSLDGRSFEKVERLFPLSGFTSTLNYVDTKAPKTSVFYRLKVNKHDEGVLYSHIARVNGLDMPVHEGYVISPNPVSNNVMRIINKTRLTGKGTFQISDQSGRIMQNGSFIIAEPSQMIHISIHASLPKATYFIKLIINDLAIYGDAFTLEK